MYDLTSFPNMLTFSNLQYFSSFFISSLFQTLLNQRTDSRNPVYLGSLIPAYMILVANGVIAFFVAGGSPTNLKLALQCRKGRYDMD